MSIGFTASSEDLVNITSGTYTVTVNDGAGCTRVQSFNVSTPQALTITLAPSILAFGQNIACFGGHGDSPRVVIAPADVEDCFYSAIEAVNIARKYSTPVLILTDQGIATRIEAFVEPDLKNICQDLTPDLTPIADHKPYDLKAADGITRHVAPGTRIVVIGTALDEAALRRKFDELPGADVLPFPASLTGIGLGVVATGPRR